MSELKVTRKKRVGLNVIELETGIPRVFHINALSSKLSKKFKSDIPLFEVIDVETGEEGIIWIDGGIKGAFGGAENLGIAVGKTYEITHKGYKETGEKIKDEPVEVNVYDIFEVEVESAD